MYLLNDKKISIDRDLIIGEGVEAITYPVDTLKSAERRAEIGIIEVPDPVRPDDTYYYVTERDGEYESIPKNVDHVASLKLQRVNGECESRLATIRHPYPDSEVQSWGKQEAEARAWTANNAAATPLIDALCAARGIPKAALVERIIAKADTYAAAVGALVGKRQAFEDQINALEDADNFDALVTLDTSAGWPQEN